MKRPHSPRLPTRLSLTEQFRKAGLAQPCFHFEELVQQETQGNTPVMKIPREKTATYTCHSKDI